METSCGSEEGEVEGLLGAVGAVVGGDAHRNVVVRHRYRLLRLPDLRYSLQGDATSKIPITPLRSSEMSYSPLMMPGTASEQASRYSGIGFATILKFP